MSINPAQFRQLVVEPAHALLAPVIPRSLVADDLVIATAAQESGLGTYLAQVEGPAVGVFQIEPASLANLMRQLSPELRALVNSVMIPSWPLVDQVKTNLLLAAMICRLFYWQVPEPLPERTLDGLWGYYKLHYNTEAGAATRDQFIDALRLTDIVFL